MKKVLIVEDYKDLQIVLQVRLELMGFSVIHANNGREAVNKVGREKPDLVLMDIMLPEMDGWEATQLIRSNPKTQHTPILVVTALTGSLNLKHCIEAGGNDYIVKPFKTEEFQEKVRKLILSGPPTQTTNESRKLSERTF